MDIKQVEQFVHELIESGIAKDAYLHRDYYTGQLQLNIEFEFETEFYDELEDKRMYLKEYDSCAYWE